MESAGQTDLALALLDELDERRYDAVTYNICLRVPLRTLNTPGVSCESERERARAVAEVRSVSFLKEEDATGGEGAFARAS